MISFLHPLNLFLWCHEAFRWCLIEHQYLFPDLWYHCKLTSSVKEQLRAAGWGWVDPSVCSGSVQGLIRKQQVVGVFVFTREASVHLSANTTCEGLQVSRGQRPHPEEAPPLPLRPRVNTPTVRAVWHTAHETRSPETCQESTVRCMDLSCALIGCCCWESLLLWSFNASWLHFTDGSPADK